MITTRSRQALALQHFFTIMMILTTGAAFAQNAEADSGPGENLASPAPPAALASKTQAPEARSEETPQKTASVQTETGDKVVSGMSIVGNDEAPKALVIVPWKTSDLGDTLDVSRLVDDGRTPVDREVFSRALDYYEIRTGNDR